MTSEMRRPIESVASKVGVVGESIKEASKYTRAVQKSVDALGKHVSDASAIQSVDLLTDTEIDELRQLINLGDESREYASERVQDEAVKGMYLQLSDLGFIGCLTVDDGNVIYLGHSPKASWAVTRHDRLAEIEAQRKAEAERVRDEDRRHSRNNVIIGWFLGLATAVVPYVVNLLAQLPILQAQ